MSLCYGDSIEGISKPALHARVSEGVSHDSLEQDIANRTALSLLRDLQNPPGLEDLAKEVGLTTFQLSRLFGRVTGKSMPAMLRERRIAEAARMLLETNRNIGDVAVAVGYYSISAFSRAFNRELRTTASDYRRNRLLEQVQQTQAVS